MMEKKPILSILCSLDSYIKDKLSTVPVTGHVQSVMRSHVTETRVCRLRKIKIKDVIKYTQEGD